MKCLVLPVLLLAFASLVAEEPQEQAKRTCRILFPSKPADALKAAYLFDGTFSQKVDLPSMNFSDVIELPVGIVTISLSPTPIHTTDGAPGGTPTVRLTEQVADFFLLVESDPENLKVPFRLEVIDISGRKLDPGETLWINHTQHKISAQMGDRKLVIPPMKRAIVSPLLSESGYYKAQFSYQREAVGEFLPIMRKSWWFDASSKNLGFILETKARLPKIFTIRDHRD